jgi:hypothetical protein
MGASNGIDVWANLMHGDAKALVCRSAAKRACKYLVDEFFRDSAYWTSSHLGRIQAGIPRTLCSIGSALDETRSVPPTEERRRYCDAVSQ